MKLLSLFALALLATPYVAVAGSVEQSREICDIIDRYQQGSLHYFDCLDHIKSIDVNLSTEATIEFVCSAVPTFWGMNEEQAAQCRIDAKAKLAPAPLTCWPEHNVLYAKTFPESYSPAVIDSFRGFAKTWKDAYKSKVEAANNGLIFDLQRGETGCLSNAYAVSLDGPDPLIDALKECVFTDINAYSTPAISPENRQLLAADFAEKNWGLYRFRKLLNTSLLSDPILAFNTSCVIEVKAADGYSLFMAGYTVD